jgi:hypothetical protein
VIAPDWWEPPAPVGKRRRDWTIQLYAWRTHTVHLFPFLPERTTRRGGIESLCGIWSSYDTGITGMWMANARPRHVLRWCRRCAKAAEAEERRR